MVHPLVLGGITSLTQVLAEASGVSGAGDSGHAQTRDAETGPLLARIIGEYHKYYTQRGKPTKQFQAHQDRVAAATQAAQEAASRLDELHHHVAEVERITTARGSGRSETPATRITRQPGRSSTRPSSSTGTRSWPGCDSRPPRPPWRNA